MIDKISKLIEEAKDSIKLSIGYLGPDPRIGFMMFKWPDVAGSLVCLLLDDSNEVYNKVIKDIEPLVYEPLIAIAESMCKSSSTIDGFIDKIYGVRDDKTIGAIEKKKKIIAIMDEIRRLNGG